MAKKSNKKIKKTPKVSLVEKVDIEKEGTKKTKIRVIGIGGGGGSIVSEIAPEMLKASFVAANTDLQALKALGKKVLRFQFGETITNGLGTGMNADIGRDAALEAKEKITKLLEGQDLCILVASLGGGVGSGAAPIFAKISKSLGNLTYGIFTLPFKFEGEKKMEIAKDALQKIKGSLNAISIIPNERVFQIIDKETPLKQALSVINKNLSNSLGGLIETIYEPGLINIDFADFRTILEGNGRLVYLNTVEMQRKSGSIKELIDRVLSSPLYPYNIKGSKGVLFNIAGEKNLSLAEVSQISKTISELVSPEAKIIFGISQNQKYSDTIKTTLLANGCGMKSSPKEEQRPVKKKRIIGKKALVVGIESPAEEKAKKTSDTRGVTKNGEAGKLSNPLSVRGSLVKNEKSHPLHRNGDNGKVKQRRLKIKFIKRETAPVLIIEEKIPQVQQVSVQNNGEEKIRKNALQIKKEMEEIEQGIADKEQFWETPAFLRRKTGKT